MATSTIKQSIDTTTTHQQPIMNEKSMQRRYGVYFDEGEGYLLLNSLSSGNTSVTMLVASLADRQVYVRKLHDVQIFDPNLSVQCQDARNVVSDANVPMLIAYKEYRTAVPGVSINANSSTQQVQPTTHHFVTPATIWEFCNGDTLGSIFSMWEEDDKSVEVPEPVVWKFFADLLKTSIATNLQGVVHQDIHQENVLLHWPLGSEVPELWVADYGLGKRYPPIPDPVFQKPFIGSFDNRARPVSDILSDEIKDACRTFYIDAAEDSRNLAALIMQTILMGHGISRRHRMANFFVRQAKAHDGVNNYSTALIQTLAAWWNIWDACWSQPTQLMQNLHQLESEVRTHMTHALNIFNSDQARARQEIDWMRLALPTTDPVIWKDPRSLLYPQHDHSTSARINRHDKTAYPNGFAPLLRGPWPQNNPLIEIASPDMDDGIYLRKGEFHVVELCIDETTGDVHFIREITSMDQVAPLSPDLSPHNDTHPLASSVMSFDGDEPFIITEKDAPIKQENLLHDQDYLHSAPLQAQMQSPPSPIPYQHSLPVSDFILHWVHITPPSTPAPAASYLVPCPAQIPEDEDEDTPVGRAYRAYVRAQAMGLAAPEPESDS